MLLAITALHVGLVGALAALAATIASPLASWLIAKQSASSGRQLAQEERQYVNRLDAYDAAMKLAYQLQAAAVTAIVKMEGGHVGSAVTPAAGDALLEIVASLEVRGSPAAADCLQSLATKTGDFMGMYTKLVGGGRRLTDAERKSLYDARDVITEGRRQLGRQVRADLGHA